MTALEHLLERHPLPAGGGDKRERGTVVVLGSDPGCPGGVVLAATAALRAGAGRVQLVVHPDVAPAVAATFPEAWVTGWAPGRRRAIPDDVADRLARADAVLLGSGVQAGGDAAVDAVASAVPARTPLLLDAGASEAAAALAEDPARCVVTAPNEHEARVLIGRTDGDAGDADVAVLAERVAERLGGRATAVRAADTVVVDGRGGAWRHTGAVEGLGTSGSGDVLAGIALALLARPLPVVAALGWAVHAHACAGRLAADAVGAATGFLAREVADHVPLALSPAVATPGRTS